jgi:hypothetical protein
MNRERFTTFFRSPPAGERAQVRASELKPWGVFNFAIPPTLTLPRKGGGKKWQV